MVTERVRQSASLLDLGGRLVAELTRLIDQRLELLRAELKQEAIDVAKSLGLIAAAGAGASVGVAFLLLALGLWAGDLVGSTPGGLAIVGGGLALIGGALGLLGASATLPRSLPEPPWSGSWSAAGSPAGSGRTVAVAPDVGGRPAPPAWMPSL